MGQATKIETKPPAECLVSGHSRLGQTSRLTCKFYGLSLHRVTLRQDTVSASTINTIHLWWSDGCHIFGCHFLMRPINNSRNKHTCKWRGREACRQRKRSRTHALLTRSLCAVNWASRSKLSRWSETMQACSSNHITHTHTQTYSRGLSVAGGSS